MQATHFIHIRLTEIPEFCAMSLNSLNSYFAMVWSKSCSHFNHDFTLTRFDYEIRKNQFAKMGNPITACCPNISLLPRIMSMLSRSSLGNKSTEYIINPINQWFISVGDLNIGLIVRDLGLLITAKISNIYASFSIYNSRQISYLRDSIFFLFIFITIHRSSQCAFNSTITIQNKLGNAQPQRLSPLALSNKRCDSLFLREIVRVGNNKTHRL